MNIRAARRKLPVLTRLGYMVDDTGRLVRKERGRGSRMPAKLAAAAMAEWWKEHPRTEAGSDLPF